MQAAATLLSQEDFDTLRTDPRPQTRERVAQKVGPHFDAVAQNSNEYRILNDIALYLQKDKEKSVRLSLAQSIQACEQAPVQLVLLLAMDDEDEIAIPILKHSPALRDEDLVKLIPQIQDSLRLVAVAERKFLSVSVSSVLADRKIEEVAVALLANETAMIDDAIILQIAQRHARSRPVLNRMIKRMPMPTVALSHMVKMQQSSAQENRPPAEIKSFTSLDPKVIKSDVLDLMLLGKQPSNSDCMALLQGYEARDNLTALLALLAMCLGQEGFFTSYLSYNTNMPRDKIQSICDGREAFTMLLNKSGISPSLYDLTNYLFHGMHYCLGKGKEPLTKDFTMSMIEVLIRAEAQKINFATTIGKPLAKVLKEMFRK